MEAPAESSGKHPGCYVINKAEISYYLCFLYCVVSISVLNHLSK